MRAVSEQPCRTEAGGKKNQRGCTLMLSGRKRPDGAQVKLTARRKGEKSEPEEQRVFASAVLHPCLRDPTLKFCPCLYHSDSAGAPVPEHLSRCPNLTLYQSFCAMKYAIYALCVNSHQHSQCQECRDSPSEDPAMAAEPENDSLSSPGTDFSLPSHPGHKPATAFPREFFMGLGGGLGFFMSRSNFIHLSASMNQKDVEETLPKF